jgi:hypothetical protein
MRIQWKKFLAIGLVAASLCGAAGPNDASEEQSVRAAVQRLFDAMSAHDATTASNLFAPSATLISVRPNGAPACTPVENWLTHMSSSKDKWVERIWNPQVLQHGAIAVLWADYDFHLNGKFHHCGVDSFNLVKTPAGWKIAGVLYTSETQSCHASPFGPPR